MLAIIAIVTLALVVVILTRRVRAQRHELDFAEGCLSDREAELDRLLDKCDALEDALDPGPQLGTAELIWEEQILEQEDIDRRYAAEERLAKLVWPQDFDTPSSLDEDSDLPF